MSSMYLASLCSKQSRLCFYFYILANLRGCCSAAAPPGFGTEIKKHKTINYFMLHYNMVHVQCLQFQVFSEVNRQCPKGIWRHSGTHVQQPQVHPDIAADFKSYSLYTSLHLTKKFTSPGLDLRETWTGATFLHGQEQPLFHQDPMPILL